VSPGGGIFFVSALLRWLDVETPLPAFAEDAGAFEFALVAGHEVFESFVGFTFYVHGCLLTIGTIVLRFCCEYLDGAGAELDTKLSFSCAVVSGK